MKARRLNQLWNFLAILALLANFSCNNYNLLQSLEQPGSVDQVKTCGMNCRIFLTDATFSGGFGGPLGADSICRNDVANPSGVGSGRWKAMLAGGGRQACFSADCGVGGATENIDWAMRPNTPYYNLAGEFIGTTNGSGIFQFSINMGISAFDVAVWTGLSGSWQHDGSQCNGWTSADNATYGSIGFANAIDVSMIAYATTIPCNAAYRLYCVEQ